MTTPKVLEDAHTPRERTFDGPEILHRFRALPSELSEVSDEGFGLVRLAAQCTPDELPPGRPTPYGRNPSRRDLP